MRKHRTLEERIEETRRKLEALEKKKEEQDKKKKRHRIKKDELYAKILGASVATYYNYLKEGRLIIGLMDKFTLEELSEFKQTRTIKKLDLVQSLSYEELQKLIKLKKSMEDVLC